MKIENFQGIKAVALMIAYDNGVINRSEPESEFLATVEEVIGADGVDEADLKLVDDWINTLHESEKEVLAYGEETEMESIKNRFQRPELLGIFDDIFEVM